MFYLVGLASRYGLGTRVQKKKRWFMNKISLLMPRGLGDAFFSPKDASSKQRTGERRKRTRGRKGRKKGKKGGGRSFQGSRKMVVNKFRPRQVVIDARSNMNRFRLDGGGEHWLHFNRINSRLVEVGDNLLSGGSNERAELIPPLNLAR